MSEPRIGANWAMLSPWLSSVVAAEAMPSANSATPSGNNMAKNDPKASTRTIAVAMSPKTSPGLPLGASSCPKALPPNSTSSDVVRAAVPTVSTARIWESFNLKAGLEK